MRAVGHRSGQDATSAAEKRVYLKDFEPQRISAGTNIEKESGVSVKLRIRKKIKGRIVKVHPGNQRRKTTEIRGKRRERNWWAGKNGSKTDGWDPTNLGREVIL